MALVQVVLRWPFSTPYQSSYCESTDFRFREGDYVTEDTNPDKFSFDHVSGDGSQVVLMYITWVTFIIIIIIIFFFFF